MIKKVINFILYAIYVGVGKSKDKNAANTFFRNSREDRASILFSISISIYIMIINFITLILIDEHLHRIEYDVFFIILMSNIILFVFLYVSLLKYSSRALRKILNVDHNREISNFISKSVLVILLLIFLGLFRLLFAILS